eukprot:c7411_g1_i1.p1 GENE.c7411_g1_i1~~c7411_g1_i1.p1  ORF type:complete len:272 (+),score=65.91 c7411_g1_i1:165-980(+)
MEHGIRLVEQFSQFQENYQGRAAVDFTRDHHEIPAIAVACYLVVVFVLPHFIKKPFKLQGLNAFWNFLLAVYSISGTIVTLPYLITLVTNKGYKYSICKDREMWMNGAVGFWTMLFAYSKIVELVDTLFLVLQKKQVIFLHWYHHLTVLLFCWNAFFSLIAPGIWFATMNYFVHSIMYSYYFVGLIGLRRVFKPLAPLITGLQLFQMVVGIVLTVSSGYEFIKDPASCAVDATNLKLGLAMYLSYMVLFAHLFWNLYVNKTPKAQRSKKED